MVANHLSTGLVLLVALLLVQKAAATNLILVGGTDASSSVVDAASAYSDDIQYLRRGLQSSSKVLAALKKEARDPFDFTKVKKKGKVNSNDDPNLYFCAHAYACKTLQDNADSSAASKNQKKAITKSAKEVCSAAKTMLDDFSDGNEDRCEDMFEDSTNEVPTGCGEAVQKCTEFGTGLVTCLSGETHSMSHTVNSCPVGVDCEQYCTEDNGTPITRLCMCTLSIESATKKALKEAEKKDKDAAKVKEEAAKEAQKEQEEITKAREKALKEAQKKREEIAKAEEKLRAEIAELEDKNKNTSF